MFWIYVEARFKAPDDVTADVVNDLCMDIMKRLCSPDFREECKRFILIKRKVNACTSHLKFDLNYFFAYPTFYLLHVLRLCTQGEEEWKH